MLFEPRVPLQRVRPHWRHGIALVLSALCVAACTEPSFDTGDGGEHSERRDAEGDAPEDDAGGNGDQLGASSTTDNDAEACEDCGTDAGGASAEAGVPSALDAQVTPSDAQVGDVQITPNDAQAATPDAQLDPVRANWAGRYAARSWVFAFSAGYWTYARYLTLAQIKPSADGGLVLDEEICFFEGDITDGLGLGIGHFDVTYPVGTRLSARLEFDADSFSSMSAFAEIGYGAPPADCASAATSRSSSPIRPWLADNVCNCPSDLKAQPTSANDCRVYDSDGDGFPGATFRTSVGTTISGVARVTQKQQLRLLNGYRSGERLYAKREYSDPTSVLSCTVNDRPVTLKDCALGSTGACPAMHNPVELYRIEDKYGCSDIIQREQGWLVSPQPAFPVGCQTAQR